MHTHTLDGVKRYWPRPSISMRPNSRTINFYRLHSLWMDSYRRDPNHTLRDAHRNLKGFTSNMHYALKHHQVDNAFSVAIKRTLRNV